jgi:Family of unknown function (DUF5317)
MVFLDFAALGVAAGLVLGGRIGALADLRVRSLRLAYGAVVLQIGAFPSGVLPWSTPDPLARALWLASYTLLIAFVVRNRHLRGVPIVGLGLLCNLVAILANKGLMPVQPSALHASGLSYQIRNNSISSARPHLAALVDRWAAPHWLPLGNIYSLGDILIGLGLVTVIATAMRPPTPAAAPAR